MARPPTSKEWVERIRTEYANAPKSAQTAPAIRANLRGLETENDPLPTDNTVRKYMREFDEQLTPEERARYRFVYWPETFQWASHELPWEAAPAVFELRQHLRRRPTLRAASWFWRVSLAVPHWPVAQRARLGQALEQVDSGLIGNADEVLRSLEEFVAGLSPDIDPFELPLELTSEGRAHLRRTMRGVVQQTEELAERYPDKTIAEALQVEEQEEGSTHDT